jgi:YbbR domain-containing protein
MLIKTIYNLLIKNLHLKIISIILAFIVFLSVKVYNNKEVIQNIDVNLSLSIPNNNILVNIVPAKVSIVVKGSLSEIKRIKEKNISLPIKIQQSKTIILTDYNIPELKDMEIIQVLPKTIDFVIEKIASKEIPIQFNTINELPAGYKYQKKPVLNKKTVIVEGPKSSIDLLDKVYTEPLNQSIIVGSESKILKLKLENSLLKFKETREVSISYSIIEEYITVEFQHIKVEFLNCNLEKNDIKPLKDEVKLTIKMPYSLKDKYSKNDFFISANLKNCENFESLTPIKLTSSLPHQKISLKYISPDTIILKKLVKNDATKIKLITPPKKEKNKKDVNIPDKQKENE